MEFVRELNNYVWTKGDWKYPIMNSDTLDMLKQCIDLPLVNESLEVDDIIKKSKAFPIRFPVQVVRLEKLKKKRPLERLKRNIESTYPIIHERVLLLMTHFLTYKREFGSPIETSFYKDMTVAQLIDRILQKRAISFMYPEDRYKLITGETGEDGWEEVGTLNQTPPLLLENCLSYDEIKLSALVYISGYTECINEGSRHNSGAVREDHIEKNALIIDLKPFKCEYCEYACRDSSTLRKHQERHLGVVRRYDCDVCDRRFTLKNVLRRHVAEVHMKMDLKKTPCEQCGKMFRSRTDLNTHVRTIHKRHYATTCDICGVKLTNKYNMSAHLLSHMEVRPYKCTFGDCTKRFKDPYSLKKHTLIHYPEKQYPCKVCGRKFTRKARLRKHRIQHMVRVKNVQCDYCGVCFYNKNYLVVHIQAKHARRRRRLVCDVCRFECANKPGMIMHLKGHSGDTYNGRRAARGGQRRRYVCDVCDVECASKTGIIMHLKSHANRVDKECFVCSRKYKKDIWLRQHLWLAHKFVVESGPPELVTDIKVEPVDVDGTPEFELFEVEKEELLHDLASINSEAGLRKYGEIEQDRETNLETQEGNTITENSDSSTDRIDDESVTQDTEQNRRIATDTQDIQSNTDTSETPKTVLPDENKAEQNKEQRKEIVTQNEVIQDKLNSIEQSILNKAIEQKLLNCRRILIVNMDKIQHSLLHDKDSNHSTNVLVDNVDIGRKLDDNNSKTVIEDDSHDIQDTEYVKTHPSKYNKQQKINPHSKDKVLKKTEVKSSITTPRTKRKSLAQIRAKLLNRNKHNSVQFDKPSQSKKGQRKTADLDQISNSKLKLIVDLNICKTRKEKNNPRDKKLDNVSIPNVIERSETTGEQLSQVEDECRPYASDRGDALANRANDDNEIKLVERTRLEYNERIRRATNIRTEKVSIKYFDKNNQKTTNEVNTSEINTADATGRVKECSDSDADDNISSNIVNGEEINVDSNIPAEDRDANNEDAKDASIETESPLINKESLTNDNVDTEENNGNANSKETTDTNRIKLRSASGISKRKRFDDDYSYGDKRKNYNEVRKIKLNTHQCYICFKLFDTKETLLDHCKDHFEVCNSTILKKCPLCDFATKLNIAQHMRAEHGVTITIPSTRIVGKESENGTGYCYKVNSETIEDIDVIPSIKHLNKQAYVNIDKRNRKLKDMGIAKTKLVKKGNEWIVERKTTKIDNVDDYILPQFDVDEIRSIRIDSNDYLSRMKKLYRLARRYNRRMVFPCGDCDKICHTLAALKLHYRRHDPQSKPFKKKVWKHKQTPKTKKVTDVDYGKKKYGRVVEIDRIETQQTRVSDNRYKKPKPVKSNHKCDPELIRFYETNVKGGDIEFWQFLKIFNKMSRENVNDFDELKRRPEYGIHFDEQDDNDRDAIGNKCDNNMETVKIVKVVTVKDNLCNKKMKNTRDDKVVRDKGNISNNMENIKVGKGVTYKDNTCNKKMESIKAVIDSNASCAILRNKIKKSDKSKIVSRCNFKRTIRISRKEYERRNNLKEQLRNKIAGQHHITLNL